MKKKETDFEELMKNVDYTRWLQALIPVMQPIIIFGAWLGFSMFDKKASAVSKLIAICEPIPTIDLNVPRPVVLASLYHSTDEALKILKDVIEYFKDLDIPTADEIIEEIKDEITDPIVEAFDETLPDNPAFKTALAECVIKAKDDLGFMYWLLGPAQVQLCMLQKGFKVSLKYIKDKLFG